MVLAYHRCYLSLQQLRVKCGVSRDGSKAGDLVRAARDLGLTAAGKQMTFGALSALRPPAILFWEFNHYVVYEGRRRRWGRPVVYINDPAQGRRRLTPEEFRVGFTGVVLTFEPGPGFRPSGRSPRPLRDLMGRLNSVRATLTAGFVTSLLLSVVGTVTPGFTKGFIDTFLITSSSRPAAAFFALMAATLVLLVILVAMNQRYLLRAETWTSTRDSARFMRHLLRLPVSFFNQRRPADIAQRLRLNDSLAQRLSRSSTSALTSAVLACAYTALLWHFDPLLAGIGMTGSLLTVALSRLLVRLRSEAVSRSRLERARLMSTAYSGIQLMETLKATGGEHGFFRRWGGHQAALLQSQQRLAAAPAIVASLSSVVATSTTVAILLAGGLRAMDGRLSAGVLIAFLAVLPGLSRPIAELTGLGPVVQDASADLAMLRDVETADADHVLDRPETDERRRLGGHLRLDDVTFGYALLSPPMIDGVSFEVGPGQQVALVGGSGGGKSTVTKLLAGLYQPWSGEILFDGRPSDAVPRSVLATSVAFVDQDVYLFQGTVRDNITLWDPSIPDEVVLRALEDACMGDFVAGRPGGIHSTVEQDGRNFSGGQRQRLEIARALVRSPSVLVLDEATSALDARTEHRISVNLRRRGCACVVIAHRLSTVRDSDEILVLDAGRVVERGNHDQLLALGGRYASMVKGTPHGQ
jgi:NHLM bacteriocin system ABC transporter peptidase/ATP-binding protein